MAGRCPPRGSPPGEARPATIEHRCSLAHTVPRARRRRSCMTPSYRTFLLGLNWRCSSAARTPNGFIAEIRGDEPEIDAKPRIEERELEAGGLN